MNCPNCGEKAKATDKFCRSCGKEIIPPEGICLNCGTLAKENDKYCRVCGNEIVRKEDIERINANEIKANEKIEDKKVDKKEDKNYQAFPSEAQKMEENEPKASPEYADGHELDNVDFDYSVDYEDVYSEKANKNNNGVFAGILSAFGLDANKESKKSESSSSKDTDEANDDDESEPQREEITKEDEPNLKTHKKKEEESQEEFDSKKSNKLRSDENKDNLKEDKDLEKTGKLDFVIPENESLDDRKILSDDKKRIYEESLEKAENNEDFVFKDNVEESDLEKTRVIDLSELENMKTEMRKVKVRSNDEDRSKKDESLDNKANDTNDEAKKSEKSRKRLDTSIIAIIVLAIIALLFVLFAVLSSRTSQGSVISKFENAVIEEDLATVSSLIEMSNGSGVSEDSSQAFVDLMNNDNLYRSRLMGAIKEDANKLNADESYQSTRPYRLESVGNTFIFFDNYKIVLDPISLQVNAGEDQSYSLASQEYTGSLNDLSMVPGLYLLTVADNDYENLVNISNTNQNFQDGSMYLDVNNLESIDTFVADDNTLQRPEAEGESENESETEVNNLAGDTSLYLIAREDSKVFINGEDTGVTVEEFNNMDGVNVEEGDLVQVTGQLPWGRVLSDPVEYVGEESVELTVTADGQGTREIIMDRVVQLLNEDEEARATMSMDPYTTIMEPEISNSQSIINQEVASNTVFYRDYKTIAFDPASFEVIDNGDGSYTSYIGGVLTFDVTETAPENLENTENLNTSQSQEIRGFHLTFRPDDAWYINLWGYTERAVDNNIENLIEVEID